MRRVGRVWCVLSRTLSSPPSKVTPETLKNVTIPFLSSHRLIFLGSDQRSEANPSEGRRCFWWLWCCLFCLCRKFIVFGEFIPCSASLLNVFQGKNMVTQHKMVTSSLKDQIKEMHSISIKTKPSASYPFCLIVLDFFSFSRRTSVVASTF
jgi:hypothetical protein